MREIKASQIKNKVKELFLRANYYIDLDLIKLIQKSLKEEISPIGESIWVSIDYFPTHIAGMPVAVNICCHAVRHAKGIL